MKSLFCSITGILIVGAISFAAPGRLFAADTPMPSIKSGKWHFTARVIMTGMAGAPARTIDFFDCMTQSHLVPLKTTSGCAMSPLILAGNTASYSMSCPSGKALGRIVYKTRSLTGTIIINLKNAGVAKIEETISGVYVSPCQGP